MRKIAFLGVHLAVIVRSVEQRFFVAHAVNTHGMRESATPVSPSTVSVLMRGISRRVIAIGGVCVAARSRDSQGLVATRTLYGTNPM